MQGRTKERGPKRSRKREREKRPNSEKKKKEKGVKRKKKVFKKRKERISRWSERKKTRESEAFTCFAWIWLLSGKGEGKMDATKKVSRIQEDCFSRDDDVGKYSLIRSRDAENHHTNGVEEEKTYQAGVAGKGSQMRMKKYLRLTNHVNTRRQKRWRSLAKYNTWDTRVAETKTGRRKWNERIHVMYW